MKTAKHTLLALAVSLAGFAEATVTANTWNNSVHDGEWTAAANWTTTTFYPIDASSAARFYAPNNHSGADVTNHLPDTVSKLNHVHVLHYAPSAFTFDGEGRVLEMGARDSEDEARGQQTESGASFYPFQIMSEIGSADGLVMRSYKASGDGRAAVFSWSNALMRTSSSARKETDVEFLRGLFDFVPGGSKAWGMYFANPNVPASRTGLRVSNATLRLPQFINYGGTTNNSMTVGSGGRLELCDKTQLFFGGTYTYAGTNTFTVSGGGQVVFDNGGEKFNSYAVYGGSEADGGARRCEFTVSGPGSLFDLREACGAYFQGNTSIKVLDGATAVLPGRFQLSKDNPGSVPEHRCELTIDGDDTVVKVSTNLATAAGGAGYFYVGNAPYSSNRVVMAGGRLMPLYPNGTGGLSMRIAGVPASNGTFEMHGGEIDIMVTNCANNSTVCTFVLGPGNALFDMSGGKVVCGDFDVGANQQATAVEGTLTHVQRLRMTGGNLFCNRLYLGSTNPNSTFQYQEAHVDLDGGVIQTGQANVFSSALNGDGYYAKGYLTANGGTLKAKSNGTCLLSNFWTAELGSKGLTIDLNNFNVSVTQSFSDKPGEKGLLVIKGGTSSNILTLSPDRYYTVSTTRHETGFLTFTTNTYLATELIVTNGATLSLVGTPTQLTVDALKVPNGTLLLDPGDSVHVKSTDIDVEGLTVKFNSAPTADQAYGVFTFDGDVTANAAVRKAMRRVALHSDNLSTGQHGAFELSYDEGTGKTTLSVTRKADSAPLTDETVWNGPSWDASGWSDGVPTATKVAAFSNASAPTAVSVPAGAEAGALSFTSGNSYTFSGEPLDLTGDNGALRLDVDSGSQVFDVPVSMAYTLEASVSAGASVAFNGSVTDGGLAKTGKGRLTLAAANDFKDSVSVGGGLNFVSHEDALSSARGSAYVTDDTVVFSNAVDGSEMRISAPVVLKSATSPTNAVIVKTDSDVVFDDFSVSSGALIKRGRGKMTIMASADKTTVLQSGLGVGKAANKQVNSASILSFDEDGSAPDPTLSQYAGFNVAEGELVIQGDASSRQVDLKTATLVGMYLSGDAATFAQPVLTIDGADVRTDRDSNHSVIGYRSASSGCAVKRSTLRVINGGIARYATLQVGDTANNNGSHPAIALTNGTIRAINSIRFNVAGGTAGQISSILRAKDSTFCTTDTGGSQFGIYLNGGIDGDVDNSFFGGLNEPVKLNLYSKYVQGELFLHNGSVFAVRNGYVSEKTLGPEFTLAFDDAEWRWGGDDMTITTNAAVGWGFYPGKHHVEMRGTGVIFKPDEGNTLTIAMPFEGTGGLVNAGAGTVKFVGDAWTFGGLLDIRSGTVDATEADAKAAATVRGPGTLKGGQFGTLTLLAAGPSGETSYAPVLDGVAASTVKVDFGADESAPLDMDDLVNVTVATYTGDAPSVGRWRVVGTGHRNVRGEFTVADGTVKMTVVDTGSVIIVR